MEAVKTFIKKLLMLETCKSPREKFNDFIEMAYCAYAQRTMRSEKAEALEARYMQIVGASRDQRRHSGQWKSASITADCE